MTERQKKKKKTDKVYTFALKKNEKKKKIFGHQSKSSNNR